MARVMYTSINFKNDSLALIDLMNGLIDDYVDQGYTLTVRQLYYQLVARELISNNEHSYKRITGLVNDARMSGLMDWDVIEDRTREVVSRPAWNHGGEILNAAADSFHMNMWDNQEFRVFCVVEKEALAGVLQRVCTRYDIPLLAARGYPSVTIVRDMALNNFSAYQHNVILHLGDHDPSGIDMTRDLRERFATFVEDGVSFDLERIALNMNQIEEKRPPPNPAKSTDARFKEYRRKFGDESWELDALEPAYIDDLVSKWVMNYIDPDHWKKRAEEIKSVQERLKEVAKEFELA